ncbi:MAG: hypothetical protein PF542_01090 [Nanoarchaeota archaeon]|jgi:hypothetical protein|nr:hypothetical protein [Nanoarchaeota archaeon]
MKKTIKQYVLPAIVAGGLALSGIQAGAQTLHLSKLDSIAESNKNQLVLPRTYLPIPEKQKTEQFAYLDSLSREAGNYVELAEESFQAGISDKTYTVKEMRETLSLYNKADSLYNKVNGLGSNIDSKYDVSLSKDANQVKEDLDLTLNGFDYGTSELEKKLNNVAMDIKIENPISSKESNAPIALLASILMGFLGCQFFKNKKE